MITFKDKGSFKNTERFLSKAKNLQVMSILQRYGQQGVSALASRTPYNTGITANSWDYNISKEYWGYKLTWSNSSRNGSTNIAILIQYGHGTGTGGYVPPYDYVNPAMRPIFDQIAEEIWKEVSRL
jgi:hypothetical protein